MLKFRRKTLKQPAYFSTFALLQVYAATIHQIFIAICHLYRGTPVIHFAWLGDMAAAFLCLDHDTIDGSFH